MAQTFRSIAIAGAWGYIGRKLLDAAARRGLRVHVCDPGPAPAELELSGIKRYSDEAAFYALDVDLFHLALHPEARHSGQKRLLERARSEPLLILNEKPITAPDTPEQARSLIEAVDRSQAVMLFDFPELFDPLTRRITEHLASFEQVEMSSIVLERSKDREDPALARNYKRMAPIQYQESVHCLAFALYVLGVRRGSFEAALAGGLSVKAKSEPYCPPNPEAYPCVVDGRCEFRLSLGGVAVEGRTNFKRGAPWTKRRVLRGRGDGQPFVIEADYLEGKKYLRINGVDQGWDAGASSYEAILDTLAEWRATVPAATLLRGVYPSPRLAWYAFQLSGALWRGSHEGRRIDLADLEGLDGFDSGFRAERAQFDATPGPPTAAACARKPHVSGTFPSAATGAGMTRERLVLEVAERYGVEAASVRVVFAPYRICPLGAHIDHQLGPVTAMAIDRGVLLAYAATAGREVRLASLEFPGEVRFELDAPGAPQAGDWGNYARGAAQALARGGYALKRGLVGVITGPWSEGGLGSSAAVGVAYLLALEEANGLSVAAEENIILDQGIENGYLGLRNGILDQSGIVLSRVKHLTYIDCLTAAHELVPAGPGMPPWSVVLAFSGLKQALVGTDYNRRVAECQAAARILLEAAGRPEEAALLGRVRAGEYEGHKHQLPEPLRRRAAHFFSEVERVHQGVEAWRQGDLREFGRLMSASGDSSIGNYECGCPPLIELYQIMVRCPGVYGARFSGAGFRGCCLGLVESARAAAAAETIQRAYRERRPDLAAGAAVVVCHSGDGARFTGAPGGGGANAGKR